MLSKKYLLLIGFVGAFFFRLGFGLASTSLLTHEDSTRDYLIGLKCYATHTWPYFGPLTMDPSESPVSTQTPGALMGLLVAGALYVWPDPVSPFVLLNILTLGGLSFLAWYCHKRLPRLSPWFIFIWILAAPWNLQLSTQVLNQSYVTFGSALFLIGFMESFPTISIRVISSSWANALMGFALFWNMNLHFSWVLLGVFAVISFLFQWRANSLKTAMFFFFLGAIPTFALVLPTYLKYGFHLTGEVSGLVVPFNLSNFLSGFTILCRYFSFASFEMLRFLAPHTPERLAFLSRAPWLWVPAIFLLLVGWAQVIAMLVFLFSKNPSRPDWKAVKLMALGTFMVVWISFWFTVRNPDAHRYYLVSPMAMVYSLYCWEHLADKRFWKIFAKVFLAAALFFQLGYAIQKIKDGQSSFFQDRDRIRMAIQANDYRLLAESPLN